MNVMVCEVYLNITVFNTGIGKTRSLLWTI